MDLRMVFGSLRRAFVGRLAVGCRIAGLIGKTVKTDV